VGRPREYHSKNAPLSPLEVSNHFKFGQEIQRVSVKLGEGTIEPRKRDVMTAHTPEPGYPMILGRGKQLFSIKDATPIKGKNPGEKGERKLPSSNQRPKLLESIEREDFPSRVKEELGGMEPEGNSRFGGGGGRRMFFDRAV